MLHVIESWNTYKHYMKVKTLGQGQHGNATLLADPNTFNLVVVKEVPVTNLNSFEKEHLETEVAMLRSFQHENIIAYHGYFHRNDNLSIVMEYAPGGTLAAMIARQTDTGVPFPTDLVRVWSAQLASAMRYVHNQRILHRDLSTSNVFLGRNSEIKLGDFGIAHRMNTMAGNMAETICGTPYYLSPEMVQGVKYGVPSDVWAIGVIIFELLTLKRPFSAPNLAGLVASITLAQFDQAVLTACEHPEEYKSMVKGLLLPNPEQRLSLDNMLAANIFKHKSQDVSKASINALPVNPFMRLELPGGSSAFETRSLPALSSSDSFEATQEQPKGMPHSAHGYQELRDSAAAASLKLASISKAASKPFLTEAFQSQENIVTKFANGGYMVVVPPRSCKQRMRIFLCRLLKCSCAVLVLSILAVIIFVWILVPPIITFAEREFRALQIGPTEYPASPEKTSRKIVWLVQNVTVNRTDLSPRIAEEYLRNFVFVDMMKRFHVSLVQRVTVINPNVISCLVTYALGTFWGSATSLGPLLNHLWNVHLGSEQDVRSLDRLKKPDRFVDELRRKQRLFFEGMADGMMTCNSSFMVGMGFDNLVPCDQENAEDFLDDLNGVFSITRGLELGARRHLTTSFSPGSQDLLAPTQQKSAKLPSRLVRNEPIPLSLAFTISSYLLNLIGMQMVGVCQLSVQFCDRRICHKPGEPHHNSSRYTTLQEDIDCVRKQEASGCFADLQNGRRNPEYFDKPQCIYIYSGVNLFSQGFTAAIWKSNSMMSRADVSRMFVINGVIVTLQPLEVRWASKEPEIGDTLDFSSSRIIRDLSSIFRIS